MRVQVQFWGVTRRLAGVEFIEMELPDDATVATLAAQLAERAELAGTLPRCAFAVGDALVTRARPLAEGERLAVLPPVAGG